MTTDTALQVFTQPLPEALARLRAAMAAEGWTASAPAGLDDEAERMARLERQS